MFKVSPKMCKTLFSALLIFGVPLLSHGADQLIEPPESDRRTKVTQLGYIDSFDAVQGKDYACVIYREEDKRSGEWELKVKLRGGISRTVSIDPESSSVRRRMSEAAVNGMDFFTWGYQLSPDEDDARQFESRIYFSESGQPKYVQVHLVTRNGDGSPKQAQIAKVNWPAQADEKLLSVPESTGKTRYKELAYLQSYDVIAARTYAYLAYRETDVETGAWSVKIDGTVTASTTIDPESGPLRRKLREAAKAGSKYVTWGFEMEPRDNDPRRVETRIYINKGMPSAVEMHLVTRKADGSGTEAQVARFDWPA